MHLAEKVRLNIQSHQTTILIHTQKILDSEFGQYLIDNPICVSTFSNDSFKLLSIAWSLFHLKSLESLYFFDDNFKQKDLIFEYIHLHTFIYEIH